MLLVRGVFGVFFITQQNINSNNFHEFAFGVNKYMYHLGVHGMKKYPMIIYRLKKYCDTGIPRYFVTS